MTSAPSKAWALAEELVALESKAALKAGVPGVFIVCEKLGPHMAPIMGAAGFTSLLSRSLKLASAKVPWLGAVQVTVDGSLKGLCNPILPADTQEGARGGVVLLAQMIDLLTSLIGEQLAIELMRRA